MKNQKRKKSKKSLTNPHNVVEDTVININPNNSYKRFPFLSNGVWIPGCDFNTDMI